MQLCHLEGQILLLVQGLAELLPLHQIFPGDLKGALGDAQALGRHADPAAVQRLHGQLEALAGLGDHVLVRNVHILQDHVGDLGGADAHLVLHLAHGEAGGALFHHEGGHALGAKSGVGQGVDHGEVGQRAVGVEALGAIDHPAAVLLDRHSLLTGGIGAGAVLGQAEGADLLAEGDGSQILLLDLVGGGGVGDAAAVQRGHDRESDAEGGIDLGDLLHGQDVAGVRAGGAADLLAVGQAEDAGLAELPEGLQGELTGLVSLPHVGEELLLGKLPGHLLNHLLLMSEREIHRSYILSRVPGWFPAAVRLILRSVSKICQIVC